MEQELMPIIPIYNQPIYRQYILHAERVQTFRGTWPASIALSVVKLVLHGLFYTGVADKLICYSCGGGFWGLTKDDDVLEIHIKQYGGCNFLQRIHSLQARTQIYWTPLQRPIYHKVFIPTQMDLVFLPVTADSQPNSSQITAAHQEIMRLNTLIKWQKYHYVKKLPDSAHKENQMRQKMGILKQQLSQPRSVTVETRKLINLEKMIECPICMDKQKSQAMPCGHALCTECSSQCKTCVTCKKPYNQTQLRKFIL